MPFGNRKKYFRRSFQFSIVTIKKTSPFWKPKIYKYRHFAKLENSYINGKNTSNSLKLNFTPNTLGCCGLTAG